MKGTESVPSIKILGCRVHMVQLPEILSLMEEWIGREQDRCHQIVVTGMHGLMEGRRDRGFRDILNSADLFIPDGISVLWIGRYRGFPLGRRTTGSELMRDFCELASQKGYRNFFYGDTEETLELLKKKLRKELPDLQVAGTFSPAFRSLSPEEDEQVIRMINDLNPDALWVGLGLPKQERWIFEHKDRLKVPVVVGVGAAFKFLSGKVKRAPDWIGEHGLEWFWRFLHEPRKLWRRVLVDGPRFVCYVLLELSGIKRWS